MRGGEWVLEGKKRRVGYMWVLTVSSWCGVWNIEDDKYAEIETVLSLLLGDENGVR